MLNIENIEKQVVSELSLTLSQMNAEDAEGLNIQLQNAKNIFLAAAGRTKLMLQGFGMRLMHIGFSVHIVGDVTTPAIGEGDLLIIASGSGETGSLVHIAAKAKKMKAAILLVTTNAESSIGKIADDIILIPASTPKNENNNMPKSCQPGASLFEQSLLIFFDSFIFAYMREKKLDVGQVMVKHANLE